MIATELRIGNLITVNNVIQEVCDLPLPENCTDENTKPIPLTEEKLLKFGFKLDLDYNTYCLNGYCIFLEDGKFRFQNDWYSNANCYYIKDLKYIHELQNLFFALTNKELEIQK
ncbi:MAG: hypothetical protein H7239_10220 [Flavobacterium sp.]|nr:hypothetical protein [Flavobacterium sp.]